MYTILVTESIALGAVAELVASQEGKLKERFPSFFAYPDRHLPALPDSEQALAVAAQEGPVIDTRASGAEEALKAFQKARKTHPALIDLTKGTAVMRLGEGGLFTAVWNLCEMTGKGCRLELTDIPLRQETIEICEVFDTDPYYADSKGAVLFVTGDGCGLRVKLAEAGIPAAVIGYLTEDKARILRCYEHDRYLDRPRSN